MWCDGDLKYVCKKVQMYRSHCNAFLIMLDCGTTRHVTGTGLHNNYEWMELQHVWNKTWPQYKLYLWCIYIWTFVTCICQWVRNWFLNKRMKRIKLASNTSGRAPASELTLAAWWSTRRLEIQKETLPYIKRIDLMNGRFPQLPVLDTHAERRRPAERRPAERSRPAERRRPAGPCGHLAQS